MADNAKPTVQVDQAGAAGAADDDAALVAALDAEQGAKPAKPAKVTKKPVAAPEPDAEDDATEADDDAEPDAEDADEVEAELDEDEDAAEDADEDLDEDDEPADELDADAAKDPALKKRLDAVRRTEERQRQRLEQERSKLESERTAWQAETKQTREAVDRIRGLAARAKIDPASVLEALGLTPDDMEYAGQQCHARSKAAAGDPKWRAASERAIRDREAAEKANENDRKIAELEAKIESKDAQAAADRELDTYFGKVFRKATDATPITARLITKRPKAARAELAVTAGQLAAKLGRMPKVAELLAAHEKREVRALKLRGIKPPTPGAGKPAAAAAVTPAGKPGAKPAAGAKPGKAAPEVDADAIPSISDLVRELSAQN